MPKKPRKHLQVMDDPKPRLRRPKQEFILKPEEFRTCNFRGGCQNIVSLVDKPKGYSGPVYCILHRSEKSE